jgi:hypothetical protein
VPADVVILSREGLNVLIAANRIAAGTDVVELGGCQKRSDNGPAGRTAVGSGEQVVLAAQRYHPFILPMSDRK